MKKVINLMVLFLPFTLVGFNCNSDTVCNVDEAFEKRFEKHLKILDQFSDGKSIENWEEAYNSSLYLKGVTGIEGNISLQDVVTYEKKGFRKDRKKWSKWFEENKCSMTISKADSLINQRIKDLFNHK